MFITYKIIININKAFILQLMELYKKMSSIHQIILIKKEIYFFNDLNTNLELNII
jgi:hypothetical protein